MLEWNGESGEERWRFVSTACPTGPHRNDLIGTAYRDLRRTLRIAKPLKALRSTCASLLDRQFGREISRLYLGRGVKGVDEQSCIAVPPDRLDEALAWLGAEYGLTAGSS
jgi:hypothetical protein